AAGTADRSGRPASARSVPATTPATTTRATTATSIRRRGLRPPHQEKGRTPPWCAGPAARVQLAALGSDGQVAAGLSLVHPDLGGDALPELDDMADDADHAAALAQAVKHGHHLFQGVLVQAAEALIDEQWLDPGSARL